LLGGANWEFIGVVIALVGIVCTIILGMILYLLQRRRKELGYRVVSHTRLVSVEAEVEDEVAIVYRGEPVRDVHLVVVEVVNWGNQPIVPDAYERALCVELGTGARVISVDEVGSKPEGIQVSTSVHESRDKVTINPLLLNAGDSFTLKVLVSGYSGAVTVAGRVVGVKEIRTLLEGPDRCGVLVLTVGTLLPASVAMYAAKRAVEALMDGSWPPAVLWGAATMLLLEGWGRWGVPVVIRYYRRLRPVSTRK